MITDDLFSNKSNCCGCEACVQICPKKIIEIQTDDAGFRYPVIRNTKECVQCRCCQNVCPVKRTVRGPQPIKSNYGGFATNEEEIRKSASGGFASTINQVAVSLGWVVYGVTYSPDFRNVEYKRCTSLSEIELLRTSKYVQAEKKGVFLSVKNDLKQGISVLFIGLPCEVSALYNFIGADSNNLYTVNLICHGPTSPKVHSSFCKDLELKHKGASLKSLSVRYKLKAWKPYYVRALFDDGTQYCEEFHKSDYGIAFRQLKRPSCSKCMYKVYNKQYGMPADLTIGDFHYAHDGMVQFNYWGSSQVTVHTRKGEFLLSLAKEKFHLHPISEELAVRYNLAYYKAIKPRKNQKVFIKIFSEKSLKDACCLFSVKLIDFKIRLVSSFKKSILFVVKPFLSIIRKR